MIKDNLAQANNTESQIKLWARMFPGCWWGLSVKKSGVIPVDIDMGPDKEGKASADALRAAGFEFPATEKIATPSGGRHNIYTGEHHFSASKLGKHIDTPNYVVIPGCGDYKLIADRPAVAAPAWIVEKIIPRSRKPRGPVGEPVPFERFKQMLDSTPYTGGPEELDDRHDYEGWLAFAMACHEAAGGDEGDYLEAFIDWCLADPDGKETWTAESIERHWCSFTADPAEGEAAVTRGSWFEVLKHFDHSDLVADEVASSAESDFAGDPLTDAELGIVPEKPARIYPPFRTAGDLDRADLKPQQWTIEGLIMRGCPQTLDGDGGVGKSLAASQIAVSVAAGFKVFGRDTIQSSVVFITHEDDERETRDRMQAHAKYINADFAALPLYTACWPAEDITLAQISETGAIKRLPFLRVLEERLAAIEGHKLLILDCLTDIVQANLFLRPPPNALYKGLLQTICSKHDCTILVLAHPSKAAMADGSGYEGGTGNKSALRNKLKMTLADKDDMDGPRWLGTLKRNYGAAGRAIKLIFRDGIFVTADDAAVTEEWHAMHDAVVAKIISMIESDIVVVKHSQANGQGPADVAAAMAEDGEITPSDKDVLAIMNAAERRGQLRYVSPAKGVHVKAHFEVVEPTQPGADFFETEE
jgi:hypothetical protein